VPRAFSVSNLIMWATASTLSFGCASSENDSNGGALTTGTTPGPAASPSPSDSASSPVAPTNSTVPTESASTSTPSGNPTTGPTGPTGPSAPTSTPGPTGPTGPVVPGAGGNGGTGPTGGSAGGSGGSGGDASAGGAGGTVSPGAGGAGGMGAGGTGGSDPGMSGRSSGCGTEPTIPSNMYNNGERISITAAGMERRYILRVPDNYDNTKAYKLIVAWHQLDGNDVQMYANDYYHLFPLSNDSAIFVAPNGQKNGQPCSTTGNGDGGCGWPNSGGSDVALGDAVVAEIKANFCIDTNRIFATGWSYGGSMSYKHACERGLGGTKDGVEGYIRGIAVYSGAQLSGQCTPSTPVAYYGSHGTSDNVLQYNGGVGLAQNFAGANGCDWSTPQQAGGNHVCTDISGCSDGYPVQFCSFNGGHTPDPSDGGGGSWQYQLVWDFFDQF